MPELDLGPITRKTFAEVGYARERPKASEAEALRRIATRCDSDDFAGAAAVNGIGDGIEQHRLVERLRKACDRA